MVELNQILSTPSVSVLNATQGLYSNVIVAVYCPEPFIDSASIKSTLFSVLMSLGWSPNQPRDGVEVLAFGDIGFVQAVKQICLSNNILVSGITLPKDPFHAYESLDSIYKSVTHFVEFVRRDSVNNTTYAQMAWNHCIPSLRYVFA